MVLVKRPDVLYLQTALCLGMASARSEEEGEVWLNNHT